MKALLLFFAATAISYAQSWTPVSLEGTFLSSNNGEIDVNQSGISKFLSESKLDTNVKEKIVLSKLKPLLDKFNYPDQYLKELAHILVSDSKSMPQSDHHVYMTITEYVMESYLRNNLSLRLCPTDFMSESDLAQIPYIKAATSVTDGKSEASGGKWFYQKNPENSRRPFFWIQDLYDLKQFTDLVDMQRSKNNKNLSLGHQTVDLFHIYGDSKSPNYYLVNGDPQPYSKECIWALRMRPGL